MSSSPSQSHPEGEPLGNGPALARKPSSKTLPLLIGLMVVAAAAAFFVPQMLIKIYQAEEDAKSRAGNIVGTRTDTKPPPGVSADPYAGMGGGGGGGGAGNAAPAGEPAEAGAKEEAKVEAKDESQEESSQEKEPSSDPAGETSDSSDKSDSKE